MELKCPFCGSSNIVRTVDNLLVCSSCGAVLDENPIDDPTTPAYVQQEEGRDTIKVSRAKMYTRGASMTPREYLKWEIVRRVTYYVYLATGKQPEEEMLEYIRRYAEELIDNLSEAEIRGMLYDDRPPGIVVRQARERIRYRAELVLAIALKMALDRAGGDHRMILEMNCIARRMLELKMYRLILSYKPETLSRLLYRMVVVVCRGRSSRRNIRSQAVQQILGQMRSCCREPETYYKPNQGKQPTGGRSGRR